MAFPVDIVTQRREEERSGSEEPSGELRGSPEEPPCGQEVRPREDGNSASNTKKRLGEKTQDTTRKTRYRYKT